MSELLGTLIGFVLTIAVFSYLLGDNLLFRLAIYLFIGVAAGYAAALAVFNVLLPQLVFPLMEGSGTQRLFLLLPLVLCALLLTKMSSSLGRLGNPSMGFLVGVGAAVTIGGSVVGTLFPQVAASTQTLRGMGVLNGLVVLVGTVSTLAYFHFGMRSRGEQPPMLNPVADVLGDIGQVFIAITLGVLFVGVYLAALAAFIERMDVLLSIWQTLKTTL
ncbi:MAG: hypothetical protein D6755_04305 [Anaerolineae bacterium]|nr:MAG: hypothetical protein D6755_04305 [Anaerolineae bacterium]